MPLYHLHTLPCQKSWLSQRVLWYRLSGNLYSLQKYSGSHPRQEYLKNLRNHHLHRYRYLCCYLYYCLYWCQHYCLWCRLWKHQYWYPVQNRHRQSSQQGKDPLWNQRSHHHQARSHLRYSQYCPDHHQKWYLPGR